jgi:hypothetical protein
MAERVVDNLEAIEIDAQDGEALLVFAHALDRVADALVQQVAVGKPGERIMIGEPPDLLERGLELSCLDLQIVANAVESQLVANAGHDADQDQQGDGRCDSHIAESAAPIGFKYVA